MIRQRDSLHFVCVCSSRDLFLSLFGKLTHFCLCDSLCLLVSQLQNGTGSRFEHLPASSSSSALRAGGTVSTDHAGDIHITRAATRLEPLPPSSSATSLPPRHPDGPTCRSQDAVDHQRPRILSEEEDRADLGGGKRKLPSPQGAVKQAALPQPQTGRERRGEEEEELQWLTRQGGAVQSSKSHMLQEWQEAYLREEGQYRDLQRSKAISGGKKSKDLLELFTFYFLCVGELILCCTVCEL